MNKDTIKEGIEEAQIIINKFDTRLALAEEIEDIVSCLQTILNNQFELKEQLEKIFKRKADLVVDKPFRNPIFKKSVDKTRIVIYER